jgi:membrane-bound lytic murein transglycosylase A
VIALTRGARFAALTVAALLAGCAGPRERAGVSPVPVAPATPPAKPAGPADARAAGVAAGPAVAALPKGARDAGAALAAFKLSCPSLLRRTDRSGLTRAEDWRPACEAAATTAPADAAAFFASRFEAVVVGDGKLFATGYYEPEIAGSRVAAPGFATPVYKLPGDLVEADLGLWSDGLKGRKVRGRVEKGRLLPYYDRAAIDDGALAGKGLELAWAADPVELFFLQVQGSGRLSLPDGSVMRIGYAGQNGRDYVAIGRVMRQRGLLGPGEGNMAGIMAWLRAHPEEGRAIMRENGSYVFFRELTGAGPLGALGVAVTGGASVAADPAFVPLGAPVWLEGERPEATGLWIAQDTGGAIKGANRIDTFWGAGAEARTIAGGMSSGGRAWLLLPVGTLARLQGGDAATPRP